MFDRVMKPVHRWVWRDEARRARKLLTFARTEADGGRDLAQAAERTSDALLRRLYLRHALDEQRHADLFRARAHAILARRAPQRAGLFEANWFAPGERGLDDLPVDRLPDETLLAFLHLSEAAAAGRFALYREVLTDDADTRELFARILRDEAFHMNYTGTQLARVAQARRGKRLWRARLSRMWKAYLRIAVAIGSLIGKVVLLVQYFVVLPLFALFAKRSQRREATGWTKVTQRRGNSTTSQYG